jgi:hypothetical protein
MTAEATITIEHGTQKSGHLIPLQAIVASSETDQGYASVYDDQTSTVNGFWILNVFWPASRIA